MRRTVLAILAALVGLAALIGVALALTPTGSTKIADPVFVNRDGAIDVSNSPTVAVNPKSQNNLVVTYRMDRPGYSAFLAYSFNGGESYEQAVLPLPPGTAVCTASPQGAPCPFGPDAAFGPDGTLYVTFVNLQGNGNRPDNLWISTSTDGGRTLSLPTKVAGALTFQPRVTVDPKGPVYVTWLQASEVGFLRFVDPPPRIVTARSDDGGKTFGAPVPVSDPQRPRVVAPTMIVDPAGQLVVMYEDLKANRRDFENQPGPAAELPFSLVVTRSTDGGKTFAPGAEFETEVLATRRFLPFLPELPQLAASSDGKLYATWADGRNGDDDVFLRMSSDGGRTWTPARKVNDNGADGTAQFLPKVDVGPGNRVSILFLDGRNDPAKKAHLDAYLATSTDGGKTFDNVRLSTQSFLEEIGPTFGPDYGTDFGTRLGLAHGSNRIYASWTDTSAGTPATGRQDVNSTAVTVPGPSKRGVALVVLFALVLAAGGAGVVLVRRNGDGPSPSTNADDRQVVSS